MFLSFALLLVSTVAESIPYYSASAWQYKRLWALTAIMLIIFAIGTACISNLVLGMALGFISIYRLFNTARLYSGRLPDKHLRTISLRSFRVLAGLQALTILIAVLATITHVSFNGEIIVLVCSVGSLIGGCFILVATLANIIGSKPKKAMVLSEAELPTLTVAIAARNETPTLVSCLESVVASDYPKLEVLVLDDDSQDTTAEIIRSYAQAGVRFVSWEKLDGDWLSKNRAYQTLLQHASGDLIFYMGVDVRLHEQSLKRAVEQMLARNVAMMTLVPKRTKSGLLAIFVQPMRYWWELAIPQIIRRRPPALSTAWLIERRKLERIGGFTSFKRSITPEEHLAKHFYNTDAYAFVRTTRSLLVTTHKSFFSQWDTQVRTRYPHAHRRPEAALLQTVMLTTCVLSPFIILPLSLVVSVDTSLLTIAAISAGLYIASHVLINIITNPIAGFFAPINFPVAIALDIIALHTSMYKYEFSKVVWKGRDVVPKKLKVVSKLPEIEPAIQGSENTR